MKERWEVLRLAKAIYELAKHDVWLGGKGPSKEWPRDVEHSWDGPNDPGTWTLSPEVELGGHRVRVGVFCNPFYKVECGPSWNRGSKWMWSTRPRTFRAFETHTVRVYIDGKLVYPGGEVTGCLNLLPTWSSRIAEQEIREGGRTGPVFKRHLLIAEAKQRLSGVAHVDHGEEKPEDPALIAAMEEVEETLDSMDRVRQKTKTKTTT